MFYGFDAVTRKAIWSCSIRPGEQEGVIIVESDMTEGTYDIERLVLSTEEVSPGVFPIMQRKKTDEEIQQEHEGRKNALLAKAKEQIDTLNDVVEFTPSEEAELKLLEWREFRAKVYGIDVTATDIEWPPVPSV